MSQLEQRFINLWELQFNHIDLHREYMFAKELKRKYRADFAHIESKVIIEIQGGIYNGRAHGSVTGIKKDCEKFFVIAQLGYLCFPLYPEMITIPNLQIIANTIIARSKFTLGKKTSSYDTIMQQAGKSLQSALNVI